MKEVYATLSGKQRKIGCQLLLMCYSLDQLVRLPYGVRMKSECFIMNLEMFVKLTSSLVVVLCATSEIYLPGTVAGHFGVHHKGSNLPT